MDLLLILTYAAFCIAIFKLFKIPLNKWTVPTAVLGGVVLVGTLVLLMNYNHPYTKAAREFYVSVPIIPAVRGVVVEVNVLPNQQVKEGSVLFRIDPTPYQAKLQLRQAELATAKQQVLQLEASWQAASAMVERMAADRDRNLSAFQRYEKGRKQGGANSPFTELELDNRRQLYLASEAQLNAAKADEQRTKMAYESTIDGVNTLVVSAQAQVDQAQFEFDQTWVRAPSDGMVTQLALRPGMMAVPMPLRPVMSFIPNEDKYFAGAFWQNSLLRLNVGDEAEVILDAAPGQIFKGRVAKILPAMAEGEVQANGTLIGSNRIFVPGRTIVVIQVEDNAISANFPAGVSGQAAIYTEHFTHVAVMRKVLLRMQSWLNYLFSEGH
ncbi:HlyD family secretion protein [Shewanella sp. NIFS-20-20]|uniref:HlyD family secretion protein n=1 Tax=Shewanella sp. NIFS-20-20 TaxID=2853806 RepID=UPI001C4869C1|nr:HlyD family secretion protein [Shewanella sp. NIFS-20-20]MBV7314444.1 HlyD family secretion protein [Shewanella sp. NIFS-20-20]